MKQLASLRAAAGTSQALGLPDEVLRQALPGNELLQQAIEEAHHAVAAVAATWPSLSDCDEKDLPSRLQAGFRNFYGEDAVTPYVPVAARGPWIVTSCGAVILDVGGYGMLGLGHAPQAVLDVMSQPLVMANIMTPSFSQHRFISRLRQEIGFSRGECPYERFFCLNSGSESVTLALRISDINAYQQTSDGGAHAGKPVKALCVKGSFHGRTDRPAQFSDSTRKYYRGLASHRNRDNALTVEANDCSALRACFDRAEAEGFFIEAMLMEPVMGEGNPGLAITPEFYRLARELTARHGSLLIVDSVQASLRAHGCLSIVDYPGFAQSEAPDMETYSKAINGGQYPLSVLAACARAAALFQVGTYGNTMTAAPRALEVACTVLDQVTPELRANIKARGQELLKKFGALQKEFPDVITRIQGTGLLLSVSLNEDVLEVEGAQGVERAMRCAGVNVIHGGKNTLRFTPWFGVTSQEVDWVVDGLRKVLAQSRGTERRIMRQEQNDARAA
jgi:acetylornithine/succinyldiaminopimelate/putrescine aminotransferase